MRTTIAISMSVLVSLATVTATVAAPFVKGELVLVTNAAPTINAGILRVDPLTGTVTQLVDIPNSQTVRNSATWDPYRTQVVYSVSGAGEALYGADGDGVVTALVPGAPSPWCVASRGDGVIYLWYLSPEGFRYLDAAGVLHDLLDAGGVAKFGLGQGKVLQQLSYDPATNSLIGVVGSSSGSSSPCLDPNQVCAIKIPLEPGGTRVAGPTTTTSFEVSTSGEVAVGMGHVPGGSLLLIVDTNSNAAEPRMTLLDPASMTTTTYASNGPYTGAAATNAGTYSHVLGRAVILDTGRDSLVTFPFGGTGVGTRLAGGVSGSGTNEVAQLVEIDSSGVAIVGVQPGHGDAGPGGWRASTPNPFREGVTLRYFTTGAAGGSIVIHDIAGRRVRLLRKDDDDAGVHAIEWDGRDDRGVRVRAGVYLADLVIAGHRYRQTVVRLN